MYKLAVENQLDCWAGGCTLVFPPAVGGLGGRAALMLRTLELHPGALPVPGGVLF